MRIILKLPETGGKPLGKPHCPYCGSRDTRRYERVVKKVKHPDVSSVPVMRRRCQACGRTFRHYGAGINRGSQSATVKVLSAFLYSIGLSYSQIVGLLRHHGIRLAKSTVWRSLKPVRADVDHLHRESHSGGITVKTIGDSRPRAHGRGPIGTLVSRLLMGEDLEVRFPHAKNQQELASTFMNIVATMGSGSATQVEGTDTNSSEDSGDLERDTHVHRQRKNVERRCGELIREAEELMKDASAGEREKIQEVIDDCKNIRDLVEGRDKRRGDELWEIYTRYSWATGPGKGEEATLWYRMRLFALRLWDKSSLFIEHQYSSKSG
jgi:transposase-like protein